MSGVIILRHSTILVRHFAVHLRLLRKTALRATLPGARTTASPFSNPWKIPFRFSSVWKTVPVLYLPHRQTRPKTSNPRKNPSRIFQGLEKQHLIFPMLGKRSRKISKVWKNPAGFFQPSEKWNPKPSNPRKKTFDFFQRLENIPDPGMPVEEKAIIRIWPHGPRDGDGIFPSRSR